MITKVLLLGMMLGIIIFIRKIFLSSKNQVWSDRNAIKLIDEKIIFFYLITHILYDFFLNYFKMFCNNFFQ